MNEHDADHRVCNLCGGTRFVPMNQRPTAKCGSCGSLERTRLLYLYLRRLNLPRPRTKVLHFAPEEGLFRAISSTLDAHDYTAVDLEPERFRFSQNVGRFDLCAEVETLPIDHFDLILHSHVLEHVRCNLAYVLFHLHRALTSDGWHVFSIPFLGGAYDECFATLDEAESIRRFGQSDHVRRFGRDDIDASLGRLLRFDPDYDATRDFSEALLEKHNIPRRSWRGLTSDTVLCLRKGDMRLLSA